MSERIAVLSTSYPRVPGDAAGHFVASEVEQLLRAGHDVHVFVPAQNGTLREVELGGARVHWLGDHGAFGWPGALPRLKQNPARALGALEFAWRAARALRKAGPFAKIQAHFLVPCGWPIMPLALSAGSRTELELVGHGSDVRVFCRLPKPLRKHIARAWLARRAHLRVTSHELAALLSEANPEVAGVTRVLPSPINVRGVPSRSAARKRFGLADAAAVAVIVSRLIPSKRVALALHALTLVEGLSIVVIGDGPELTRLATQFPTARFVGRVPRPDALAFIAAADVLVSASREEGAPTVIREARALGVPVVAVAAGDLASWAERDSSILLARD